MHYANDTTAHQKTLMVKNFLQSLFAKLFTAYFLVYGISFLLFGYTATELDLLEYKLAVIE